MSNYSTYPGEKVLTLPDGSQVIGTKPETELPPSIAPTYAQPTAERRPKRNSNPITKSISALTGLALASTVAVGAGQFAGNTFSKGKLPTSVSEVVDYVLPDGLTGDK